MDGADKSVRPCCQHRWQLCVKDESFGNPSETLLLPVLTNLVRSIPQIKRSIVPRVTSTPLNKVFPGEYPRFSTWCVLVLQHCCNLKLQEVAAQYRRACTFRGEILGTHREVSIWRECEACKLPSQWVSRSRRGLTHLGSQPSGSSFWQPAFNRRFLDLSRTQSPVLNSTDQ